MIIATIIVKFSSGKIKKYYRDSPTKEGAVIAIEQMKKKIKKHLINLNTLGVIWDGENKPWKEEVKTYVVH